MIAFLIYDLNVRGGTHKQFLKLLDYSEKQGQDFIVLTKYLEFEKTYPGFFKYKDKIRVFNEVRLFPHWGKYTSRIEKLLSFVKLRWMIRKARVINVHDNGWEFDFPAFIGKRVIWQVNDLPGWFKVGASSESVDTPRDRALRELTLRNNRYVSDFVVNVGKNAQRIKDCYNRNAHIFYCGVEPLIIDRDIQSSIKRFKDKKVRLLSSGVFFPYRNYETQVRAVKLLREKGYEVELRIIGALRDKEYARVIQKMINDNHLNQEIIIEGQVDESRFEELHKNADIFLFININQSWGLAVFEAMSCGLPVIVSNSVGATEILNDKEDSIFVNPSDENEIVERIEQLVKNPDFYTSIIRKAQEFPSHWSWDEAYCSKMYSLLIS